MDKPTISDAVERVRKDPDARFAAMLAATFAFSLGFAFGFALGAKTEAADDASGPASDDGDVGYEHLTASDQRPSAG